MTAWANLLYALVRVLWEIKYCTGEAVFLLYRASSAEVR